MKRYLGNNIKILSVPVFVVVGIIILIIISMKMVVDNVTRLGTDLGVEQAGLSTLQFKLNSLEIINSQISNQSQVAILALPGVNSVLSAVSQIKNQAGITNLTLGNLRSDSIPALPGSTLESTELDFDAEGNFSNISNFILNLKSSLPIITFDSIKIKNNNAGTNNSYILSAVVWSYWSPLPNTIPAINEPVIKLSAEEEKILNSITSFQTFSPNTPSSTSSAGRANPFSL